MYLYFGWFQGETALEHVGLQFSPPTVPHTLISDMNFLSGERRIPDIWGVYWYLS